MKIAFVSAARSSHTVKWVNALAKRGHTVRLYSLPDHVNTLQNIDDRVTIIYLKTGGFQGYFLNAKELRQHIEEFHPDIVNCHYASSDGKRPELLSSWSLHSRGQKQNKRTKIEDMSDGMSMVGTHLEMAVEQATGRMGGGRSFQGEGTVSARGSG